MQDDRTQPPTPFDDAAFRRLAEFAPDGLIAHDAHDVLWANDAAARLLGLPSPSAMVGRAVLGFVAPESLEQVKARVARMLATGNPEPSDPEFFLHPDGQRVPVEVSASPLGGGVVLVAVRDLRPRLQAEHARHTAEARSRAFFDASTAAMGISRAGVHVEVNAAYAQLFGYPSPEALNGVPILDLIDPADHARIKENVRLRSEGVPAPSSYPAKGRRRDGTALDLEVHASGYVDAGVTMTVVVMRDVTAQREAEQRLAQSERRHRELLQRVPVGVWEEDLSEPKRFLDELKARGVTDFHQHFRVHPEDVARCTRGLRVLSVNAAACEMVGAKDEAELLANLHRVFLPESLPDLGTEIADLMSGSKVATSEGWNGTLTGDRRWVAVRATLDEGHEDDWSRLLVTTTDITDRWKARQEKEALEEQLRHAEKLEAVGRLAGGVAHDFNNLLAAILSSAEVSLEDVAPGSGEHESLTLIHEAALRARDLVKQILTFSRKDKPKHTPIDLSQAVEQAMGLARAAIPSTVALSVAVARDVGTVLADRTQVHQVVLNLCANARDAVGPHGRIDVSLCRVEEPGSPPRARLRVKDDGMGMDSAVRARLFEPYLTTKAQGHGLGLAVVHGIVEAAGGTIDVESAPAQGSCFDVLFPLVEAAPAPVAPVVTGAGGHEHVLVVDDQPMVRTALRRILVSLGYRVTEACDGQEALERFRAAPADFDLVVSDQTMPRLTGLELARALHAERPQARIIICSGFSDALDEASVQAAGVTAVMAKPVDRATMAAAVRRALA